MAVRINWDIYEAVILLDALIAVREGRLSRKAAAQAVSRELRERAVANGIEIDDTYRNENGISWQLSLIKYIYNDTTYILSASPPKVFNDAVDLYKNDRAEYDRLLSQARNNKSASQASESFQEDFLKWLEGRVSPEQLSTYYLIYTDINEYMLKKAFQKPIYLQ